MLTVLRARSKQIKGISTPKLQTSGLTSVISVGLTHMRSSRLPLVWSKSSSTKPRAGHQICPWEAASDRLLRKYGGNNTYEILLYIPMFLLISRILKPTSQPAVAVRRWRAPTGPCRSRTRDRAWSCSTSLKKTQDIPDRPEQGQASSVPSASWQEEVNVPAYLVV